MKLSAQRMWNFFQNQILTDVKLCCKHNTTIKAHRLVLAAHSDYFLHLLWGDSDDRLPPTEDDHGHFVLQLPDVEYDDMLRLVEFLYCGRLWLPSQAASNVFHQLCRRFAIGGPFTSMVSEAEVLSEENQTSKFIPPPNQQFVAFVNDCLAYNRLRRNRLVPALREESFVWVQASFENDQQQTEHKKPESSDDEFGLLTSNAELLKANLDALIRETLRVESTSSSVGELNLENNPPNVLFTESELHNLVSRYPRPIASVTSDMLPGPQFIVRNSSFLMNQSLKSPSSFNEEGILHQRCQPKKS